MENTISIGSIEGDSVSLKILGRSHPDCTDFWDGNWLRTDVVIRAGSFHADFNANFRSEELAEFLNQLNRQYAGTAGAAHFQTMEGQLELSLVRDRRGHVHVSGTAFDKAGIGNMLEFHFETDQTFLPPVVRDLNSACTKFPVIGKIKDK